MTMGAIGVIAGRELRALFLSPLAWVIAGVVQCIAAYLFLASLDHFLQWASRAAALEGGPGVSDVVVAPLFANTAVMLLLVAPLITMRLLAEERRHHTLTLLLSAPVSMTDIVLGKYLGAMGFFGFMLLCIVVMPLSLSVGGPLDVGKIAAGALGLCLVVAAFVAVGLLMSALTAQPTVAAITTLGVLLGLWVIDGLGHDRGVDAMLRYLSLRGHLESLLKGVFNSADVAYYVLLIVASLGLSIWRLDADRLRP